MAAIVVGVILFGGGPARATAAITVDLAFEVEPDLRGCPDADAFRASVRRQLGYDPFAAGADRTVAVSIARKAGGFNGRIQWNDASGHWAGERRLSSRKADCTSLAQDMAFSVAVQVQLLATLSAVDPKASTSGSASVIAGVSPSRKEGPAAPVGAASAPSPSSPLQPPSLAARPTASDPLGTAPSSSTKDEPARAEPKAPLATAPSPTSQTQASGSSQFSLSAGLGPAFAWGLAPQPTPVGRLFVDARWSRISIELAIDAAWPVTHQVARVGGFKLDRAGGTAAGCGHVRVFVACVLGTVGVLWARGVGVDDPSSPTAAFYQLGGRLGARFDFGRHYFAGARVDGVWSPSPWTVDVNGVPVWTTPRLGALVGVDVGVIFF